MARELEVKLQRCDSSPDAKACVAQFAASDDGRLLSQLMLVDRMQKGSK